MPTNLVNSCCKLVTVTKHRGTLPAGTAQNNPPHPPKKILGVKMHFPHPFRCQNNEHIGNQLR